RHLALDFLLRGAARTAAGLTPLRCEELIHAADAAAEEAAKDVRGLGGVHPLHPLKAESSRPLAARAAAAETARRADEAEAVVLIAFGLVAEDVVGFLDFLEPRLGLLVAGIAVGMVQGSPGSLRHPQRQDQDPKSTR